jgi:hypothetical protein
MTDTLWMTESVGRMQLEVIRRQLSGFAPNEIDFAMVEQNVLQGDPAIPIFGHEQVDYAVNEGDYIQVSLDEKACQCGNTIF